MILWTRSARPGASLRSLLCRDIFRQLFWVVLHFVRLWGIVWKSARMLVLRQEILYLCAFASFSRDAITRKKTAKIPILMPVSSLKLHLLDQGLNVDKLS